MIPALALPYPEHLGPARGTYRLSCRPAISHGYDLGILHFPLGATLKAVRLHQVNLPFRFFMINSRLLLPVMSIASIVT